MKNIIAFLFTICCINAINAQKKNTKDIDSFLSVLESNDRFNGTVVLMKNGKIQYSKSKGYASIEDKKKNDLNSLYQIGSISKTYTATLILKAIEEGRLSLDTKLVTYFPTIPNATDITIEQVLYHQSGIFNFTNDSLYEVIRINAITRQQLLSYFATLQPEFSPGELTSYSNTGYVLLTFILEDIYNKPFAAILKEKIIDKLGLKHTHFGSMENVKNGGTLSYNFTGKWNIETPTHHSITMGAGGIIATAEDVVLFADGLFNEKIISKNSLSIMKNIKQGIGMGLFQFPFDNESFYGHTGGIDGYQSVFGYNPKDSVSFAIITNGINYEMNDISIALLSHQYKVPITIPTFTNYKISESTLTQYVGVYENKEYELTFHITQDGNVLYGRIEGQSALAMEAVARDTFEVKKVGAVVTFNLLNNSLILTQMNNNIVFNKK